MCKAEIALEILTKYVNIPDCDDVVGEGWRELRPIRQAEIAAAAYNAILAALKIE